MPELPEVETVVRSLAPRITGRRIEGAEFRRVRVLRGDPDRTAAALAGRRIAGVRRHGKFILIDLAGGGSLLVHLGMTGKLLLGGEPGKHTHAVLTLDRGTLIYDDPRMFGRLEFCEQLPEGVARLGPEPLEVDFETFVRRLGEHRTRIKSLLLNQNFLRGVGNIYADEALFRARIHPLTGSARIRRERARRLYNAIREVLAQAIERRGSSVSSYVDSEGRRGGFQQLHRVYQRTGEPCTVCGAPIRRTVVVQRSTHYCPRCQRI